MPTAASRSTGTTDRRPHRPDEPGGPGAPGPRSLSCEESPMVRVWTFVVVAVTAALAGCGSPAVPRPAGHPISGKVLLANGRPVSTGRIYFMPADRSGAQEWVDLNTDGSFKIDDSRGGIL